MSPTLRANQVSAQREPVSALAQGKIPEIGKRRSETGPRNRAGKRLNPPLNERGDAFRRRKPLTLRPFHENRRKSPQARNAWLGREDSNLRMAESKSAALPLGDAPPRPANRRARTIERPTMPCNPVWRAGATADGGRARPGLLTQDAPRHAKARSWGWLAYRQGHSRGCDGLSADLFRKGACRSCRLRPP